MFLKILRGVFLIPCINQQADLSGKYTIISEESSLYGVAVQNCAVGVVFSFTLRRCRHAGEKL